MCTIVVFGFHLALGQCGCGPRGGQFGYWPTAEKMEAWNKLFAALVKSADRARYVVHWDVYLPDGTRNYSLSRNVVCPAGRWSGTLPLALNDPAGQWTVRAREVCSGLTAEVQVQVQK